MEVVNYASRSGDARSTGITALPLAGAGVFGGMFGVAEYPSLWWIDCLLLRKRHLPRRGGGSSDQCKSKSTKREEKRSLTRSTDEHYKEELTNP